MTAITASAPGKLFLLGEYAVLDGAPALLTAVDRRATVTIEPTDDAAWHLHTPGLSGEGFTLGAGGALPRGLGERELERLRVFEAVRTVVAEAATPAQGLDITIDSTAFHREDGAKLGLGSSAAVAVALTAALSAAHSLPLDRESIFARALSAHRAAQGGTGSGGDVATSTFGGLISYSKGATPVALPWPRALTLTVVVTGDGSSTTDLVARVSAYRAADPAGCGRDIAALCELARGAEAALDSPSDLLRLASDYFDALMTLDEHAGAGIVSEHHRRLHSLSAGLGGVFKTSGAGGGDVGLLFTPEGEVTSRVVAAFAEAGAEAVPLAFGERGLELAGVDTNTQIGSVTAR
ncbi:mevalonate kinase family protein [Parafrigoribacterium soli]|uniref:mevalonate kinase family protein n=1 Tax=Parafrigoribacterium soli TaxID=3144663 RepID=UPI0032ECBA15